MNYGLWLWGNFVAFLCYPMYCLKRPEYIYSYVRFVCTNPPFPTILTYCQNARKAAQCTENQDCLIRKHINSWPHNHDLIRSNFDITWPSEVKVMLYPKYTHISKICGPRCCRQHRRCTKQCPLKINVSSTVPGLQTRSFEVIKGKNRLRNTFTHLRRH